MKAKELRLACLWVVASPHNGEGGDKRGITWNRDHLHLDNDLCIRLFHDTEGGIFGNETVQCRAQQCGTAYRHIYGIPTN